MGGIGLEPAAKTVGKADIGPGALPKAPLSVRTDPRLKAVVNAWPHLSESVKAAVMAMVEASKHRVT